MKRKELAQWIRAARNSETIETVEILLSLSNSLVITVIGKTTFSLPSNLISVSLGASNDKAIASFTVEIEPKNK